MILRLFLRFSVNWAPGLFVLLSHTDTVNGLKSNYPSHHRNKERDRPMQT